MSKFHWKKDSICFPGKKDEFSWENQPWKCVKNTGGNTIFFYFSRLAYAIIYYMMSEEIIHPSKNLYCYKNISIENISSVLWRLSWGHLKLPIFTIAGSSVSWKTVFLFLITTWILKESWMTFVRSHQNRCIFLWVIFMRITLILRLIGSKAGQKDISSIVTAHWRLEIMRCSTAWKWEILWWQNIFESRCSDPLMRGDHF